jgi:hypothetical protein
VDRRISRIQEFATFVDPYSGEERELSEEEIAELTDLDIAEMVTDALEDRDFVDYPTLSSLLKHPVIFGILPIESRKALGEVLLRNAPHLYPLAEDVAGFFSSFVDQRWQDRKRVRNRLLASIRPRRGKWPPEYYIMWILNLFAQSAAWRHAPDFARIFRDHRSDLVRRMAALAIGANGSRADALETRDRFAAASPLEQLAILVATKRLGTDERRHWKTSLQLRDPLEKRI